MAFLPSNKIKVYPTANRLVEVDGSLVLNTDDLEAAYNSEHQLTTSGGTLGLSRKSFIQVSGAGQGAVLRVVINGYRFDMLLSDAKALFPSSGDTYAFIKTIDKDTGSFAELVCADSNNTVLDTGGANSLFKGLCFDSSIGQDAYGIKIATDGELLPEAMLNISTSQISDGDNSSDSIKNKFTTAELNTGKISAPTSTERINVTGDVALTGSLTSTGNVAVPTLANILVGSNTKLIDLIYPVGSIYLSLNSDFSPSSTWGGTWEVIAGGTFLMSCSQTIASGTTGGTTAATGSVTVDGHALTIAEMPSHGHETENSNMQDNTKSDSVDVGNQLPELQVMRTTKQISYETGTSQTVKSIRTGGAILGSDYSEIYRAEAEFGVPRQGGGQEHTHNATLTMDADSNLPPYLAVYMWKRTA